MLSHVLKPYRLLATLGLLCITCQLLSDELNAQARTISINGYGEVKAAPDRAEISFQLSQTDKDMMAAMAIVDRKSDQIVDALKKRGIDKKDVQGEQLRINPKHNYDHKVRKQIFIGYEVNKRFVVTIKSLPSYPKILADIMNIGIHAFGGVSFNSSLKQQYEIEAMDLAIKDSTERATRILKQYGEHLGKVRSISLSGHEHIRPLHAPQMMRLKESASAPGQTLTPGQITFKKSISVVFDIR